MIGADHLPGADLHEGQGRQGGLAGVAKFIHLLLHLSKNMAKYMLPRLAGVAKFIALLHLSIL